MAATVALMLEVNPELSPAEIKEILIATRKTTKENKNVGGLIDVVAAVKEASKTIAKASDDDEMLRAELIKILR